MKKLQIVKKLSRFKDLGKSFKRNVKIIMQGACIQRTETLLLKCTKLSHLKHT